MSDIITIANASGFIAVAIIVVQFVFPTLLTLALAVLFGNENNAVTWSVVGKLLQESWWPTLLRTDSVQSKGVKRRALIVSWAKTGGVLLIAAAGVATPLGLYDGLSVHDESAPTFEYQKDSGPFGYATPERSELGFSRTCSYFRRRVCPGVSTPITINESPDGAIEVEMPEGEDSRIPRDRYEYFGSGYNANSETVSGIWDIEYRRYTYTNEKNSSDGILLNNGSAYLVGSYAPYDNTILVPQVKVVEGLIVDADNGAIGFRNHSLPINNAAMSRWSEDILFMEPETVCIPNNFTINFTIADSGSGLSAAYDDVKLVDLGGFSGMDWEHFPEYNGTDSQNHLDLRQRAYRTAFLNNVMLSWMFNISDYADPAGNPPKKPRKYTYMNSRYGDAIDLEFEYDMYPEQRITADRLRTSTKFNDFLHLPEASLFGTNKTLTEGINAPNPFNISMSDFTDMYEDCLWFADKNPGNISAVAVQCVMVQGMPLRPDGRLTSVIRPGDKFYVPLYTCASAVKASIKTVDFKLNGTDFSDFTVENIREKTYDDTEVPTWAVEDTDMALDTTNPIWGMVDPSLTPIKNVSSIQREYLYLPGRLANGTTIGKEKTGSQNMPGTDFHMEALAAIGKIALNDVSDETISSGPKQNVGKSPAPDYSGGGNPALAKRWQETAKDPEGIARALRLVWTDIAASQVVGTKGMMGSRQERELGKREESLVSSRGSPKVTVYKRTVQYKWPYAIPAFLVIATTAVTAFAALFLCVTHRAGISTVRRALNRTSIGRVMGSFVYPDRCPPGASTKDWVARIGVFTINYSGPMPRRNGSYQNLVVLNEYPKESYQLKDY